MSETSQMNPFLVLLAFAGGKVSSNFHAFYSGSIEVRIIFLETPYT